MAFNKLLSKHIRVTDPVADLTEKVSEIAASSQYSDESIGKTIATESFDATSQASLESIYNSLESTVHQIAKEQGLAVEDFQIEAATMAGMLATNPKAVMSRKLKAPSEGHVMPAGLPDAFTERPISLEAYDERENRNSQTFSIIYNLLSSRQDEFGETFFPTIVVNPNEVGVTVAVKLFYVYNDFKRSVTGALANYARKNLVRAYADASILKNEQTRAYPIIRATGGADDNTAVFVPVADLTPRTVEVGGGITVTTSALADGAKVDLIGLSQTNELLNSGIMGPTDTLDTYIRLEALYVSLTDGTNTQLVRIETAHNPFSVFTYAVTGNSRRMVLNMDSDGFVIDENTLDVQGNPITTVLPQLGGGVKARIRLAASGSVVLDKSECQVSGNAIELVVVRDSADAIVSGATYTAIENVINSGRFAGYDIEAYRANSNLRQRGQLLDTQLEYQVFQLPYRSPIASLAPAFDTSAEASVTLQNLITTTGIRVSNDAVFRLLEADTVLSAYKPTATPDGNLPELASIGRFYVKPVYFQETIDLSDTVDSLKSHERIHDIRAAIVEKIRYYANEMYRVSEYKAAASVLTGNTGFKPTVIVGTDPVIANYIQADGDLRTLGETFEVKVVSTIDSRVKGKIFVTFGVFDGNRNTSINPLNFGNMLWSPELTVMLPISRDGQTSKEMIVTPRYNHIVNLPVMTRLDVSGLPTVTGKVKVNFSNV